MRKILMSCILISTSMLCIACSNQGQKNNNDINNINVSQQSESIKNNNANKITVDKAKEIALKHANLKSDQVTFIKSELEFEDGIEMYNIEFYFENTEYDYEVNAVTGEIIKYDYDAENYEISQQNNNGINNNVNKITADKAKEIALKHANLKPDQVTFIKSELEFEDGIEVYDIEFYLNNIEYSYKINVNTGDIVSYEKDLN